MATPTRVELLLPAVLDDPRTPTHTDPFGPDHPASAVDGRRGGV
ncbi:hypothetical protein ACWGE0_04385 [Lentzea sp. NPDC054927]